MNTDMIINNQLKDEEKIDIEEDESKEEILNGHYTWNTNELKINAEFIEGVLKYIEIKNKNKIQDYIAFDENGALNGDLILHYKSITFDHGKIK